MNANEKKLIAELQAQIAELQATQKKSVARNTGSNDPFALDLIAIAQAKGIHKTSGCVASLFYDSVMRIVRNGANAIADSVRDGDYSNATHSVEIPQLNVVLSAHSGNARKCTYSIVSKKDGAILNRVQSFAVSDWLSNNAIRYQTELRATEAKKVAQANARKQTRNSDTSITNATKRVAIKRSKVTATDAATSDATSDATESVAE